MDEATLDSPSELHDWLSRFVGESDMGRAIRDFDWLGTSLGPIHTWPVGLRTAVGITLTSRFPMMLVWGPELIKLYNDAYRPMLGATKHPRALGSPAHHVWPEIWDEVGPLFRSVLTSGAPTWAEHQRLVLDRNGFPEECYFTFSYSPLFDGDEIGGVLDVVVETTEQIVSARRLACLSEVMKEVSDAQQVTDVCVRALEALSVEHVDIRAADIYLLVDGSLALLASNRRDDVAPLEPEELLGMLDREAPSIVGWAGDDVPAEHCVMTLGSSFGGVHGVMVASLHAERPFDAPYRGFVQLIADSISHALDSAYTRTVEIGEYRRIGDTLQAAMLKPASDFATVAARYLPAIGNLAVGGDWYDVVDLGDDRRGLVVGDCVGHGLEAATVMSQLRSATRALLLEGHDPAKVLERLDLFADSVDGAFCTTVVCAIFDRRNDAVTYSRAGHPPPMLVNHMGVTWLDGACGPPLAALGSTVRTNAQMHLQGGDIIVMYSDGLIERRGEDLALGFDRLARAGTELYGAPVHGVADGLLRRLLPENTRDDVVLMVKQLASSHRSRSEVDDSDADVVFAFDSTASAPRQARNAVLTMLGGDPAQWSAVALAVSELVSNVLVHGGGSGRLLAWNSDPVRIRVDDSSLAVPTLPGSTPGPDEPGGRGMSIIDRVADRWGVEASPHGKTIWAEFARSATRA